ncbi:hypothetical protein QKA_1877 [Clostridioides difficile DA00165]|nr:hypothetical protein QKA_1877 [Clostridioides difficile DA00165]
MPTCSIIPAFQGSAKDTKALSTKSKNACINVAKTLIPLALIIKLPERIPISKEIITFLVINASIIATNGGIKVKIPNFSALASAIVSISSSANHYC